MQPYLALAQEVLDVMDHSGHRPPHEEMSRTIHGEMAVLRLLMQENRQLMAGDISKRLRMTTARIAAVLNSLEKKEMIIRCADPDDRRRVMVLLTEGGKSFCLHKRAMMQQRFARLLSELGEEDARQFVRLLSRFFVLMAAEEKDDAPSSPCVNVCEAFSETDSHQHE